MVDAIKNLIFEDCKKSCKEPDALTILANKTILVTGGTGFMGKWITEMICFLNETQDLNIKLYLLSRDSQKFEEEVPHLVEKSFVNLIEQDVRNLHDLPEDINYIIHAAGSPDNRDHVSQPLRTMETFYKGTNAVLEVATRLPKLEKFVHISSHLVYGKNDIEPFMNESFLGLIEPNHINHVYGKSKLVAETLCTIYRNQFRMPIVTLRPFAFIGPYQDLEKPWALNNFIRDGILGSSIRIIGNGATIRSYLYASDMAYWIIKTLVVGSIGETYNIGSDEPVSLNDLAKKIQTAINPSLEIISKSSKENYTTISRLVPNIAKITKSLNVEEVYSLDEAINRTIVWNQLNKK
ncbi:MAG: NAD(P)-dependent oxidoreductase [Flavobacterium sp.]|nr:MAG: NAD(P)-dependent oxidoreductase [Flavobacterium sp.]